MTRGHLALLVALLAGGCAQQTPIVVYTPLSSAPRRLHRRPEAEVQVFTMTPPAWPYVEVGSFEIRTDRDEPDYYLRRLRYEAARVGCDGLVMQGLRHHYVGLLSREAVQRANCITYTPPRTIAPPAPPPPPAPADEPERI